MDNTFKYVRELKRLLLKYERQIARNLTIQLIVFATGVVSAIYRAVTKSSGVKLRIQLIIESELFRNKCPECKTGSQPVRLNYMSSRPMAKGTLT